MLLEYRRLILTLAVIAKCQAKRQAAMPAADILILKLYAMVSSCDVENHSFDYVVIGGGTAGLTTAARLSEDPTLSVVVLEAGPENLDDPLIIVPAQFGKQFGNPKYDWAFKTVRQKHCNDRIHDWARGRMLGGSSAINFYAWSIPPSQDIDAWEKLGNPGWDWESYSRNVKKTEKFIPPNVTSDSKFGHVLKTNAHGHNGSLLTSFPELIATAEIPIQETLFNVGIEPAKNPVDGDPIGSYMTVCTLDPKTATRTYSVTASYLPNRDRPNLRVLCNALVRRIVTTTETTSKGEIVRATGVEFEYEGEIHIVYVKKDVILSAGALKSPQILELSGIGDSRRLSSLGITPILDLPGVGENMQEHMFCAPTFELNPDFAIETLNALDDEEYAASQLLLHAQGKGFHRLGLGCFTFVPLTAITSSPEDAHALIARQRQSIESKIKSGKLPPGLKEQYELQLQEFESGKGGDCEIIAFPGTFGRKAPDPSKSYISILAAVNHTFSRGSVHATSNNPHEQPDIDPRYFEDEFDLEVLVEIVKFIRRLPQFEPLKGMVAKEVLPGLQCQSDEDLKRFIKDSVATTYHSASTLSMLPRSHNGVVDPELIVYGTKNIRVADLSIIPLHVAAHTQATAYAIAEQAANIIKSEHTESA